MITTSVNNDLIKLIRTLGIPTIIKGKYNEDYNIDMMHLARANKVHLLYAIHTNNMDHILQSKHDIAIRTILEVSDIFNVNKINYALFKTIRPFPYMPSDVDILIERHSLVKVITLLEEHNYSKYIKDSLCTTMKKDINVDLYLDPSVSNLAYLDGEVLMKHKSIKKINDTEVHTLTNYAEIIAVACHSFYKEQLFTLSDYYTLTILAEEHKMINDVINFARITNATDVLKVTANICKRITLQAFETDHLIICKIADLLNQDEYDACRDYPNEFITLPYKFSMRFVMKSLMKKVSKEYGNITLMKGILKSISLKQLRKLFEHKVRETYAYASISTGLRYLQRDIAKKMLIELYYSI